MEVENSTRPARTTLHGRALLASRGSASMGAACKQPPRLRATLLRGRAAATPTSPPPPNRHPTPAPRACTPPNNCSVCSVRPPHYLSHVRDSGWRTRRREDMAPPAAHPPFADLLHHQPAPVSPAPPAQPPVGLRRRCLSRTLPKTLRSGRRCVWPSWRSQSATTQPPLEGGITLSRHPLSFQTTTCRPRQPHQLRGCGGCTWR